MAERVQKTVEINRNLLAQAEDMGLDISQLLEERLVEAINQANVEHWRRSRDVGTHRGE